MKGACTDLRGACGVSRLSTRLSISLLYLLKNLDMYLDDSYDVARGKVSLFAASYNITRQDVDSYIRLFPVNVFRYYYELRLDDVFA